MRAPISPPPARAGSQSVAGLARWEGDGYRGRAAVAVSGPLSWRRGVALIPSSVELPRRLLFKFDGDSPGVSPPWLDWLERRRPHRHTQAWNFPVTGQIAAHLSKR